MLLRRIVSKKYLDAVYTDKSFVCNTDVITLKPKFDFCCKFYLGIINSKLIGNFINSNNITKVFPK
ncbi:MAG: hypothetical protein IPM96_17085 [Ignavibacteria bacterium]|nr:hypothetical protein [Ignavibacteria bacterium]